MDCPLVFKRIYQFLASKNPLYRRGIVFVRGGVRQILGANGDGNSSKKLRDEQSLQMSSLLFGGHVQLQNPSMSHKQAQPFLKLKNTLNILSMYLNPFANG